MEAIIGFVVLALILSPLILSTILKSARGETSDEFPGSNGRHRR